MLSTSIAAFLFVLARVRAQSPVYGQCGGQGWTGATTCAAGSTCTYSNPYYSQCIPGGSGGTTTAPATTTSKAATTTAPSATAVPSSNDGIAIPSGFGTHCGSSTGTVAKDVVQGLPALNTFKTIVSFGDSYTSGGKADGTTQPAAVLSGTNPKAGGRTTNGPVWIEDIATDIGATFMDYAVGGAVTDVSLWPSKSTASDFINQTNIFLGQKHTLSSTTTLYTVFFGINDFSASSTDGDHLPQAAQVVLNQIKILISSPTNARNFLITDVYARGGSGSAAGDNYKSLIFEGMQSIRASNSAINYAYADFKYIWEAVIGGSPAVADGVSQWTFKNFGYTSNGACTANSSSTVGMCSDPAHTFYWIPGHPSKETHRIMADYTKNVLTTC